MAAYVRPKKGDVRVFNGVAIRFGESLHTLHDEQMKRIAQSPGAGLWARGLDPKSPTLRADAEAWYTRYRRNNPKGSAGYNRAFSEMEFGREDAKAPGVPALLQQGVPIEQALDVASRGWSAQNALPKREFDIMTIIDPIIEAGLGWINPALAAGYGALRAGMESDWDLGEMAKGGVQAYGMGQIGSGIGAGVKAAGSVGQYISNIPGQIAQGAHNVGQYLQYGPELISVNSLIPSAGAGAAAGLSSAARAAGTIGAMNNPGRAAAGSTAGAGPGGSNMGWFTDLMDDFGVSKGDLLRAGVDLYSGMRNADVVQNAARQQSDAAMRAANIGSQTADKQMELAREIFAAQTALNEPFRQGGVNALNRMQDLLGLSGNTKAQGYGSLARNFSMSDFQADPGYAFRMSEGLKALDRQAAARGGLISGGALKAAQGYGQDLASQEYMNAFNRFQTNRTNLLNPLQSIAGTGQTATNTLTQAGQNMGTNVGNAIGAGGQAQATGVTDAAAARASGYMGAQEGWNRAITNALSRGTSQDERLMNEYIRSMINANNRTV